MATLPLQSCRMAVSLVRDNQLEARREAMPRERDRLGTAIKANPASGAALSGVARGMYAVGAQFGRQLQTLRRAGFDAQPTALALFIVDRNLASCWRCHRSPHCGRFFCVRTL